METLTGKQLLEKVGSLNTHDVRELAIACGYGFESISAHGEKIIKARKQKFIKAYQEAGGDADKLKLDKYASQKKYSKAHKETAYRMSQNWRERNKEKLDEYYQRPEIKEKVRKASLACYYKRKAKAQKVDEILEQEN